MNLMKTDLFIDTAAHFSSIFQGLYTSVNLSCYFSAVNSRETVVNSCLNLLSYINSNTQTLEQEVQDRNLYFVSLVTDRLQLHCPVWFYHWLVIEIDIFMLWPYYHLVSVTVVEILIINMKKIKGLQSSMMENFLLSLKHMFTSLPVKV